MSWTLWIPLEIPSQNALKGRNWRAVAAATKRRRAAWAWACAAAMRKVGCPPAKGPRSLHIIAYRRQRCRDIANLIGGAKACIDGLVDAGLLVDDSDKLAEISYDQRALKRSPTKRACTQIIVGEIT